MRSTLDVVDITTAGSAFLVTGYRDAHDTATFNSYGTVTAAVDTATASGAFPAGWFHYTFAERNNDPCEDQFLADVSIDQFGTLDGITETGVEEFSFPLVRFTPIGNDYIGTIKRGLPQGILYPVWFEAVPSNATLGRCVSCAGLQMSAEVRATRLHVP
jgi:hypothetical protein